MMSTLYGSNDEGAVGHALDLAVVGIGHTGEEVHQTAGDFLVGGLQVQHDGALVVQVVCNGAGILEALGLDQNDLELGGGMDVDHLAVLLGGDPLRALPLRRPATPRPLLLFTI